MTNAHQVPFTVDTADQDVQDFIVPTEAQLQQWVEEGAETWDDQDDVTQYIDYNVEQIRNLTALAQAADEKAKFAAKTANGFKANVEYRRGLIEATINSAVSRGLLPKPAVKSAEYSLGIQSTAGSVEIDPDLDYWREEVAESLEQAVALLLSQVMNGAPIGLPDHLTEQLAQMSIAYINNADPGTDQDLDCFKIKLELKWDKVYIANALKKNWLTDKLAALFTVVKGKALVIRL